MTEKETVKVKMCNTKSNEEVSTALSSSGCEQQDSVEQDGVVEGQTM